MFLVDIDYGYKGKNSIMYKDVKFRFEYGEFINILGENGCGKSTLYKVFMGKLKPIRGEIASEIRDNIVVVSDYVGLPDECLIKDVVKLLGDEKIQFMKENFYSIYQIVCDLINKKISMLSTGQKRIVEIFCALSTRKNILVLDEASNGLDIYNRQILIEEVKKVLNTKKIVVLNTTHHIEDVVDFGGRVFVMNKNSGKISEYKDFMTTERIVSYMRGGRINA